jgi:5S rRNA maturation endonuclease (ribonuclease M5)
MGNPSEWVNVQDAKLKCPVCGKPDWCLLHVDGKKVLCPRVKSVIKMGKAGYLHKLRDNGLCMDKTPRRRRSNRCINWTGLARLYFRKAYQNPAMIDIAEELAIPSQNLRASWRLGWNGEAYTIPAYNGYEEMNGIMRRWPKGEVDPITGKSKAWVPRSKNGLFIPKLKSWQGNLFICEGWSDAAALVQMGFRAIARANCQTGKEEIKTLIQRKRELEQVCVVGDNDKVGETGAMSLARSLSNIIQVQKLDVPEKYKDMREWYQWGAHKQAVVERVRFL